MPTQRKAAKTVTYQGSMDLYEGKLERVMTRFGATDLNWALGREEAWIEFRLHGQLYRFDHSIQRGAQHGIRFKRGSDVFAQLVLALEDLSRLTERGIYELQTWLTGMRALPATSSVPQFLQFMRFDGIPDSVEDVKDRYRTLALTMHPDAGGSNEDWLQLQSSMEQATRYYAAGGQR